MHSRSLGSMEVLMSSVSIVSETGHRSWQAIKKDHYWAVFWLIPPGDGSATFIEDRPALPIVDVVSLSAHRMSISLPAVDEIRLVSLPRRY